MTSISENMYVEKLDDIVNKYSNKYHREIKMASFDVKSSAYIDFDKENNKNDPKFNVWDHVRKSEYKTVFATGYLPNWSEEVFLIKKVKSTVP